MPVVHKDRAGSGHVVRLRAHRGERHVAVAGAHDRVGQPIVLGAEQVDGALGVLEVLERLAAHLDRHQQRAKRRRGGERVPPVVVGDRHPLPRADRVGRLAQDRLDLALADRRLADTLVVAAALAVAVAAALAVAVAVAVDAVVAGWLRRRRRRAVASSTRRLVEPIADHKEPSGSQLVR